MYERSNIIVAGESYRRNEDLPIAREVDPSTFWQLRLEAGDSPEREFLEKRAALSGFIVVSWDKEGRIQEYWHDQNSWDTVNETRGAEDPRMYKSLRAALAKIRRSGIEAIIRETPGAIPNQDRVSGRIPEFERKIGLAFWIHPDYYALPLEKIQKMADGHRLPGGPRQ